MREWAARFAPLSPPMWMGGPFCSIPKEKYPREVLSARNLTRPKDQAFRRLATMMQALAR